MAGAFPKREDGVSSSSSRRKRVVVCKTTQNHVYNICENTNRQQKHWIKKMWKTDVHCYDDAYSSWLYIFVYGLSVCVYNVCKWLGEKCLLFLLAACERRCREVNDDSLSVRNWITKIRWRPMCTGQRIRPYIYIYTSYTNDHSVWWTSSRYSSCVCIFVYWNELDCD